MTQPKHLSYFESDSTFFFPLVKTLLEFPGFLLFYLLCMDGLGSLDKAWGTEGGQGRKRDFFLPALSRET